MSIIDWMVVIFCKWFGTKHFYQAGRRRYHYLGTEREPHKVHLHHHMVPITGGLRGFLWGIAGYLGT